MTSALLKVDVNTAEGRESVAAFKEWMRAELGSVSVSLKGTDKLTVQLDEAALNSSLVHVLGKAHHVGISSSLTEQIKEAIGLAFKSEHEVKINHAHLTAQVAEAIKAGMTAAGTLHVGGAPGLTNTGGGNLTPAMIAEAMRQSITPLVDKIDQTTKAGIRDATSGKRSGSISDSAKTPTGQRVGLRESITPDDALSQIEAIKARTLAEKQAAEQRTVWDADEIARRKFLEGEYTTWWRQTLVEREALMKAADDEMLALVRAEKETEVAAAKRAAEEQAAWASDAIARRKFMEGEYTTWWKAQLTQRDVAQKAADEAMLAFTKEQEQAAAIATRLANEERAVWDADAVAHRKLVEGEYTTWWKAQLTQRDAAQKAANEAMIAYEKETVVQATAVAKEKAELEAAWANDAVLRRKFIEGDYTNWWKGELAKRDAIERAALEAQVQQQKIAAEKMKAQFAAARASSGAQDYTGTGKDIFAASSLAAQHGNATAREFLGPRAYLLDMTASLEQYRKKVTEVGAAHANLTGIMHEAHSAARGLAGSLDAMWVTWGSIAPLVAGAALGSALRSVIEVGRETEYQLAFVSALSNGAVVDLGKFGDAVRGNLILPAEAAAGMRALAQNGLDVADSLRVLPDILRLATVGEMSVSDAALGATGVMAAFNLGTEQTSRVVDVFSKAAADSNTSVKGMVEAMKQASTVGDKYHLSIEEVSASLAILAKRNITNTQAGTAFRNMMQEIATPTDSAKKAINALGLQFYDGQGNLKGFMALMDELKSKTDTLNEKSRLTFLDRIFGERGGKAVSALLSDMDKLKDEYDVLQNKSQNFAQSVVDALGESTTGRMKGLVSEFQLVSDEVFGQAKGSVNSFVEALRSFVDNPSFKEGLAGLTNNVGALAKGLVDNLGTITLLGGAWATWSVTSDLVRAGMTALMVSTAETTVATTALTAAEAVAAAAAEAEAVAHGEVTASLNMQALSAETTAAALVTETGAAEGATIAARGMTTAMAGATLGLTAAIAILVPFLVQWVLFKDHTDELTTSIDNDVAALHRHSEELDNEYAKLVASNQELARRNELMAQGKTATEAKAQSEGEARRKTDAEERARLQSNVDKAAARLNDANNEPVNGEFPESNIKRVNDAEKAWQEATKALVLFNSAVRETEMKADEQTKQSALATANNLRQQIEAFNKAFSEFRSNPGSNYHGSDLTLTEPDMEVNKVNNDRMAADLAERQKMLNAAKEDKQLPDQHAAHIAQQLEKATTAGLIQEIHSRESEMKAYFAFRQQLDEKLFASSTQNELVKAAVLRDLNAQEQNEAKKQYDSDIARLKQERDSYKGADNAPERQKLDNEIAARQRNYDLLVKELSQKRQIADADAANSARKDQAQFDKRLSDMTTGDQKYLDDLRTKNNNKFIDPGQAAYDSAYQAIIDKNSGALNDQKQKLLDAKKALEDVKALMESMPAGEITDEFKATLAADEAIVSTEERRLALMQAQSEITARKTADAAKSIYEGSQTAGAGWDKFWANWSANATSNAKIVEDVMTTTFQRSSDALAEFVVSGKGNFRSLVSTIIAEAARMLATKAFTQLVSIGISMFGGSGEGYSGAGSTGSGFGNAGAGDYSITGLANAFGHEGGGQTLSNKMYRVNEDKPELYDYDGKQYLMAGSKGGQVRPMDQMYSPPNRGSTQMTGSQGPATVNMNTNVTVHADGSSKVSTDTSDAAASKFGDMINNVILMKISEQQRPGGLLYGTR